MVPRQIASVYFDAADELACNRSLHSKPVASQASREARREAQQYNSSVRPLGYFLLHDRLVNFGTSLERLLVGYTLVRAGVGVECFRLKGHPETLRFWSSCINQSRWNGGSRRETAEGRGIRVS